MKDTKQKLSTVSLTLHWLVGIGIIGLLAHGTYMHETKTFSWYDTHKSLGVLIFTIILIRVIWRIRAGWPQAVSQYTRIEQLLSKTVHWVLMIATVLMPIFGLIGSGLDGHGFGFFGLEIVAENPDPTKPFASIPYNETVAEASKEMHELVGTLLMAAIALHVVGALKHHLIDKDGTMRRIFGAKV